MSEIVGIGMDVVNVNRIRRDVSGSDENFLSRFLSEEELDMYRQLVDPIPHYCGLLAAKEAVIKVISPERSDGMMFKNIRITGRPPVVSLSGKAEDIARTKGIRRFMVSVTHGDGIAAAVSIGIGD